MSDNSGIRSIREEGGERRATEDVASRIDKLLAASVRDPHVDAEDDRFLCKICRDSGIVQILGPYAMRMLVKGGKYFHVRWQRESSACCICDYAKARNDRLKYPLATYDPKVHVRVSNRNENQIDTAIDYWRRKRGEKSERLPTRDVR